MKSWIAPACVLLLALTSCAGGGGQPGAITPPLLPPTTASMTFTAATQATTVTLPSVGGFSGTLQLPPADELTSITLTISTSSPPSPAPAMAPPWVPANSQKPLLYFAMSAASGVTLAGFPGMSVTLPPNVEAHQTFYAAEFSSRGGWETVAGPGSVDGSTVTLGTQAGISTIEPGAPLVFALYAGTVLNTP